MKPVVLVLMIASFGCAPSKTEGSPAAPPVPEDARWLLEGTTDERFVRAAAHLRGFDMAMVETGQRYAELAWAGRDRNWGYAEYQLRKIETAVARGVERRPRRAASAKMLDAAVAPVRQAITARDGAAFDASFEAFTVMCNACHKAEKVAFIHVVPPTERASVVVAPVEPLP